MLPGWCGIRKSDRSGSVLGGRRQHMRLKLTSGAFNEGGKIPDRYSRKGGDISPPLEWDGVEENCKCLAMIMDDPDAPTGPFVHWLLYRIPLSDHGLKEGLPH